MAQFCGVFVHPTEAKRLLISVRRASRSKIEAWHKATPNANIGIVTGAISELVVLDLDSADAIAEAERRGLPDTLTVSSRQKSSVKCGTQRASSKRSSDQHGGPRKGYNRGPLVDMNCVILCRMRAESQARLTHRKPIWLVEVSIISGCRAAGRYRWQWFAAHKCDPPFKTLRPIRI